jgi:tRNA dimethylallyltransferase
MKTHTPSLVIIVGSTATGKTAVASALAEESPGRIISADSMQVYRHMDIGTAKPTQEEREKISYHLIDVVNPDEPFNGAMFLELSGNVIKQRAPEGEPVYVVGGTGLYVKILLGGLISGPGPNEVLREQYKRLAAEFGKLHLYDLLKSRDPLAADRIKANDTVRVIRALEVLDLTGESITTKQVAHAFQENRDYRYLKIGIKMEKEPLQQRIEKRVEQMMERGLLREVEQLLAMGYGADLKSMQSLGYRHMVGYLRGEWSLEEAVAVMKRDTWQYAKRQMTWFKKDGEILWFHPEDLAGIRRRISDILM